MANNNQIPTKKNIGGPNGGVTLEYQGFQQTRDQSNLNTQVTYQSTRDVIESTITGNAMWKIGTYDDAWGRLDSINSQPGDGPFWKAVLNYNMPLSAGIIITTPDGHKEPTQNSLTVRMMSMPIESHPNYCYIWNHSLAADTGYSSSVPEFSEISGMNAEQAQILVGSSSGRMRWIQSDSQLPTDPVITQNEGSEDVFTDYWKVYHYMTKPGVSTYDFPTYEISESAKHTSRNDATWSLLAKNGKLKFPQYGDFGIQKHFFGSVSGHWLCEGAEIDFDGKYYVVNCTYLFSPDDEGWDKQLYTEADGGYYLSTSINKNSIFDH